jgi:hypothetical protein
VGNIKSSGVNLNSDGTASTPSIAFTNDPNSGVYSISDNVIGLSINGSKIGEINSNGVRSLGEVLIVEDQKTANTNGGTFTSGAWRTRDLNSVRVNRITGASLSSNQITLPAGTYRIFASAPAFDCDRHKARLYNVTSAASILDGSSEFSGDGFSSMARSIISGEFTLPVQSVLTIEHRCQNTESVGFGVASNFSVPEIYTQVIMQRLA